MTDKIVSHGDKPPIYEEKWEEAALYHDRFSHTESENEPEQGREDRNEEEVDEEENVACRIAFYISFFILWALIYAYFLHVPTLGRKLFHGDSSQVELPIQATDTNIQLQQAAFENVNNLQQLDSVKVEVEGRITVDREHGIIIEEITFNIPESERDKLMQIKKDQKGPFGKPERSFTFPGFIQAKRRNPFESLMQNSRIDSEEPVALIIEVDQGGTERSEEILVPQDILL